MFWRGRFWPPGTVTLVGGHRLVDNGYLRCPSPALLSPAPSGNLSRRPAPLRNSRPAEGWDPCHVPQTSHFPADRSSAPALRADVNWRVLSDGLWRSRSAGVGLIDVELMDSAVAFFFALGPFSVRF